MSHFCPKSSTPFLTTATICTARGVAATHDTTYGFSHVSSPPLQAWLAVNLTADLRDSFTWNTRQIYLWLTTEYRTQDHNLNQAVFWNWIIESQVE